jgi:hypothetical protein
MFFKKPLVILKSLTGSAYDRNIFAEFSELGGSFIEISQKLTDKYHKNKLFKNLENYRRTYKKYPQIKFCRSSENNPSHKTVFEIFHGPTSSPYKLCYFITFIEIFTVILETMNHFGQLLFLIPISQVLL